MRFRLVACALAALLLAACGKEAAARFIDALQLITSTCKHQ